MGSYNSFVVTNIKIHTYLIVDISTVYYFVNGYSWGQTFFAAYFHCYWGCTVTSKKVVATVELNNVIMVSHNCTTIAGRYTATTPLSRLNLFKIIYQSRILGDN